VIKQITPLVLLGSALGSDRLAYIHTITAPPTSHSIIPPHHSIDSTRLAQVTLPAGVLYKSHHANGKNGGATFAQAGQALTWSGIDLAKKGAAQTIRLKVNVTNCADGQLAFAAATTVGGVCPATATPATAGVKHAKGWVACPSPTPTELCGIPTGTAGIFACTFGTTLCAQLSFVGTFVDPLACAQAALAQGYDYVRHDSFANECIGMDEEDVADYSTDTAPLYAFQCYSLVIPRTPPQGGCGE
jgi:hypothetical protein